MDVLNNKNTYKERESRFVVLESREYLWPFGKLLGLLLHLLLLL